MIPAAEANADHRPQLTPGRSRLGRRYATHRTARRGLHAISRHLETITTALALPSHDDLLAEANRQLGKPYRVTGCRCSDQCYAQDCSGLVCGAAIVFIPTFVCTSSFGLARLCRDAGTLITEEEAIWTPGAIGIENAWGVSNGALGTNGHVVYFEGDGKSTIEEMGTHYGCTHGPATGRGFNAWARLPGFNYDPPPPPVEENDMQVFVCPNKPNHPGAHAQFVPAGNALFPDGALIMRAGASIAGDQHTKDANVRLRVPITGQSWVACTEQDDRKGLQVLNSEGVLSMPGSLPWT